MMNYLQKRVIDQNDRSPSSTEKAKIRCGMTASSWSGSRAKVMQSRAEAIRKLVEHERADISTAAQIASTKLVQFIDCQKEREQREDMEREQRFE